jgi:hypothetical protein
VFTSQNLTQKKGVFIFEPYATKEFIWKNNRQSYALKQCSDAVLGFNIKTDKASAEYVSTSPNEQFVRTRIKCEVSSDLKCDQDYVSREIDGQYTQRDGEGSFSRPPLRQTHIESCKTAGFSTSNVSVLAVEKTRANDAEGYSSLLICSGRQSSCSKPPLLGQPRIVKALDCGSARVESGLIQVTSGTKVTSLDMLSKACTPLGFDTVKSLQSISKKDEIGNYEYYTVSGICSSYRNNESKPLINSCKALATTKGTATPLTCDKGLVTKTIFGEPRKLDSRPSDSQIRAEVCNESDYANLDEVISATATTSASSGGGEGALVPWSIEAMCSVYSGPSSDSCEQLGPCFGEEVSPSSQEVKISYRGKTYKNLCEKDLIVKPTSNTCDSCVSNKFLFTDSTTGNTCSVTSPVAFSGEQNEFKFSDTSINGTVNALCNSGVTTGLSGKCYKSCPGNISLGWADKNGNQSCANTVPSGVYIHEQVVNFGSSLAHTGNASFKCNGVSGRWEQQGSANCKLDCASSINWGSGISKSGVNKNGLCYTNARRVKNGASGIVPNMRSGASGSAKYSCNDGVYAVTSFSCNVECASSKNQLWGGACSSPSPTLSDGGSARVSHVYNRYSPFASTVSGIANLSCSDGRVNASGSCSYVIREDRGNWSQWEVISSNCAVTPSSAIIPDTERFEQTTNCSLRLSRSRNVTQVWNNGRKSGIDDDISYANTNKITKEIIYGTKVVNTYSWSSLGNAGVCYATGGYYSEYAGSSSVQCNSNGTVKSGSCMVEGETNMFTQAFPTGSGSGGSTTCIMCRKFQSCQVD